MIRVLIIDDSAFNRRTLQQLLMGLPDIEVVDTASDGIEAMARIRDRAPDVVTLDLEMPHMDGLSLLRWMMVEHPIPVLVVTSRESNKSLFEALEHGAIDFILKPGRMSPHLAQIRSNLVDRVRAVARCRVRRGNGKGSGIVKPGIKQACFSRGEWSAPSGVEVVALAASTGGPPALQRILVELPGDYPAAILVVQHMPEGFTGPFARRLDGLCALSIAEASEGDAVQPGRVLVAPGGSQMAVVAHGCGATPLVHIENRREGDHQLGSADHLMKSVSHVYGSHCAGIVLTGMGDDGTEGLRSIHEAGGVCIAEAEESAVVFGMPQKAIASGAVDRVLPIDEMSRQIIGLVSRQKNGDHAVLRTTAGEWPELQAAVEGGSGE